MKLKARYSDERKRKNKKNKKNIKKNRVFEYLSIPNCKQIFVCLLHSPLLFSCLSDKASCWLGFNMWLHMLGGWAHLWPVIVGLHQTAHPLWPTAEGEKEMERPFSGHLSLCLLASHCRPIHIYFVCMCLYVCGFLYVCKCRPECTGCDWVCVCLCVWECVHVSVCVWLCVRVCMWVWNCM